MLLLTMLGAALAAEPTLDVRAVGTLGRSGDLVASGVGLGGTIGLDFGGRLDLELATDAGATFDPGPLLAVTPQLRLFLSARDRTDGALSLSLGGGLLYTDAAEPAVSAGLALDLPGGARLGPRVQARYILDPTDASGMLLVGVGISWPRHSPPEPEPVPVAEPEPLPPAAEPYRWVPHPVNECVAESQVSTRLLSSEEGTGAPDGTPDGGEQPVAGPDGEPLADATVASPLDMQAMLEPRTGGLVIVTDPGDVVTVAGHLVPRGDDWATVLTAKAGPQLVIISGAGRERTVRPSVAPGYATWVRASPDHQPHLVLFDSGSSTLDQAATDLVRTAASLAGDWTYELVGRYSPEGNLTYNRALALARAEAVQQALIAAGMPADRLVIGPVEDATSEEDPARQRSCRIQPVPPAEAP